MKMKVSYVFLLLLGLLVIAAAAKVTKSSNDTRTTKVAKVVRKKARQSKKNLKKDEETKSESHHVPVLVAPVEDIPYEVVPLHVELTNEYHPSAAEPLLRELGHHFGQVLDDGRHPHSSQQNYAPQEYYPEDYGDLSAIPGLPGVDYPTYSYLPHTGFKCLEHTSYPGFYADVETRCQMWHYCQPDGRHDRFLCPNGTVFDQLTRVCNWWFNVHCDESLAHYDINFDLYREPVKKVVDHSLQSLGFHSDVPSVAKVHQGSLHPISYQHNYQGAASDYNNRDYHQDDAPSAKDNSFPHGIDAVQSNHGLHEQRQTVATDHPTRIVFGENNIPVAIPLDDRNSGFGTRPDQHFLDSDSSYQGQVPFLYEHEGRDYASPVTYRTPLSPQNEEIPTYRERKASPSGGRKYRVVKRRKLRKDY